MTRSWRRMSDRTPRPKKFSAPTSLAHTGPLVRARKSRVNAVDRRFTST